MECFCVMDADVELGDTRTVAEALARSKQGLKRDLFFSLLCYYFYFLDLS